MAEWTVTREHNPARGDYWVVRRDGVRTASAPTQASAKRMMRELKADEARRGS